MLFYIKKFKKKNSEKRTIICNHSEIVLIMKKKNFEVFFFYSSALFNLNFPSINESQSISGFVRFYVIESVLSILTKLQTYKSVISTEHIDFSGVTSTKQLSEK